MTRDDILRMAREAGMGFKPLDDDYCDVVGIERGTVCRVPCVGIEELERFATLVAAAEREACANECDKTYHQHIGDGFGEVRYGIAACAAAIRARSTQ